MTTRQYEKQSTSVNALFDYAVSKPEGFTLPRAAADLGWDDSKVRRILNLLRQTFAGDTINLVCESPGYRGAWLYRLVGTFDEAKPWLDNRTGDLLSRVRTLHAVASSVKNGTDGRTKEGKTARLTEVALRHLIENIETVDAEFD